MTKWKRLAGRLWHDQGGAVFVEYLLLVTVVGIGLIAGLCVLREALFNELQDLADAISAITI